LEEDEGVDASRDQEVPFATNVKEGEKVCVCDCVNSNEREGECERERCRESVCVCVSDGVRRICSNAERERE
jgi:hypothetical protein